MQLLVSQLPLERIVTLHGDNKLQRENQYLSALCDRVETKAIVTIEEKHKLVERKADIRVALRTCTDPAQRQKLEEEFAELTKKLES